MNKLKIFLLIFLGGFLLYMFFVNIVEETVTAVDFNSEVDKLKSPIEGYSFVPVCSHWTKEICTEVFYSEPMKRWYYFGNMYTGIEQCQDFCVEYDYILRKDDYSPMKVVAESFEAKKKSNEFFENLTAGSS